MDTNNIMNEGMEIIEDVVVDEGTGMSNGAAALIGAGVALAVCAGIKLGKKLWAAHKAKKELRQPDSEIELDPEDVAEVGTK